MLSLVRSGLASMKRGSRRLRKLLRKMRKKHATYKLWLEPLEDRTLMAVSITGTVFQDLVTPDPDVPLAGIMAYLDTQSVTVAGQTGTPVSPPPATALPVGAPGGVNNGFATGARLYALEVSGLNGPFTDVNLNLDVSNNSGSSVSLFLLSPAGVLIGPSTTVNSANTTGSFLFTLPTGRTFSGTLDDEAAGGAPTFGSQPAPGTYKPTQAFNQTNPHRLIYGTTNPNGTWYLVASAVPANFVVNSWSLSFRVPQQVTMTDASGNYSFSDLTPGAHQVGIAVVNPPAIQNVNVVAGQPPVTANFAVTPPPVRDDSALTTDANAQQQPSIAVNPNNANHVVIAYMDYGQAPYNGFARIAVQTTTDGGQTWTQSFVPMPVFADGAAKAAGYAKVAFDLANNVYVSFMAATFHGPQPSLIFPDGTRDENGRLFRSYGLEATNGIFVAKSSGANAGVTWGTPVAVTPVNVHTPGGPKVNFFDVTPDLAVDTTSQAATVGNVYVTWTRIYKSGAMPSVAAGNGGTDVMVAMSTNGGTSYTQLQKSEQQTITRTGGITPTVRLSFNGVEATTDLAMTAATTNAQVLAHLNTIAALNGKVTVTGAAGGAFTVTFTGTLAGIDQPMLTQRLISGTGVLTIAEAFKGVPTPIDFAGRSAAVDEGGGFNNFPKITILYNTVAPFVGALRIAFNQGGRFLIGVVNAPESTLPNATPNSEAFFAVPQGSSGQVNSIFPDLQLYPDAPLHNFPVRSIVADPTRPANLYVAEAVKQNSGLNTTTGEYDRGDIQFAWSQSNGGNIANFRRTFQVGNNTGNEEEVNDAAFNNLRDFLVPLNDDNNNRYLRFDTTLQDEVLATQAQPMLAIDRVTGNLVAIWLDNRRDPTGRLFDIYGSVSTNGGLTWSANFRITDQGFDPRSGRFTDGRGNLNAFIGDSLGLAVAGGFVYTAWTDTRDGNQNIYFSKFGINAGVSTPNDRFENNNTAATATAIGDVGAEQFFPKLVLTAGDEDWFLVSPQGGKLFASIQGSAAVQGLQLELLSGAQLLAGGTDVLQSGQFVRKEISQALAAGSYLLKVSGATATTEYSLRVNSLTADLGATIYSSPQTNAALTGAIAEAGAKKLFAVTSVLAGSIEIDLQGNLALIPRLNGEGVAIETATPVNIVMEIIAADGTVLDSFSVPSGTTVVRRHVAVEAGQNLLISLKADDSAVATGRELSGSFNLTVTNFDQYQTSLRSNLFFATGATPTDLTVADLNNDGRLDLIAATTDPTGAIQVLRGTGVGLFWGAQGYKAGAEGASREIVIDKFNGAGDAFNDVVVTNFNSADVSLLTGNGDTTLAPERRSDATARAMALAVGDFNGDGFKDLVVLERTPAAGSPTSNFSVILGRGDGTFGPPHKTATTLRAGANIVLVDDMNGDGLADIVVLGNNEAVIEVHLGNGNGTFQPGIVNVGPEAAAAAAVKDINGDGKADLIVGGTNNGSIYILEGLANGTFAAPRQLQANTNVNAAAASISSIVIVDAGRNVANGFLATKDGIDDIIVLTVPRVGSEGPHVNFLAGTGGGAFAAAQRVRSGQFTGPLAAGDFNNDGEIDLVVAEAGGIRAIYGTDITITANTSMGAARNLGDLKHIVTPPQAISPLVTESWFRLTVPSDPAGTGDQVLDFSTLFQNVGGAGLDIEVRDAAGNVVGSGRRFRISAAQGATLFVRVFSIGGTGFGTYTMSIDVLPQLVGVQALSILPGVLGQPNGPAFSLLLTIQGDRLDRDTATNPDNYRVTWLGADGIAGTPDDRVISLSDSDYAVIYNQAANVEVSSGRSFPAATRQSITLNFDDPLPAGSYLVEIVGLQTDDFNGTEDSQLVSAPGINGHSLVSINGGVITEGAAITATNLVQPSGAAFNFNALTGGTAFLTQLHSDLGALLDGMLAELGDVPDITAALTDLIQSRFEAAALADPSLTFAILWFDPVSISLEDPQGARTTYNLQNNTLQTSTARTYIEVGGNVQVIVMAGVSGTFQVNVADVQNTARGGAAIFSNSKVETVAFTDSIRDGNVSFSVHVPPSLAVPAVPPSPGAGVDVSASALIDSSVATLTTILVGLGNVSTPDLGANYSDDDSFVRDLRIVMTTLVTQWSADGTEMTSVASILTQFMAALETVAGSAEAIAETAWVGIEQTLPGAREFGDAVQDLAATLSRSGVEVGEAVLNRIRSRLTTPVQPAAPVAPNPQMNEDEVLFDGTGEDAAAIVNEADLPLALLHEKDDAFLIASLFAAGAFNQAYRSFETKDEEKKNRKTMVPQI